MTDEVGDAMRQEVQDRLAAKSKALT